LGLFAATKAKTSLVELEHTVNKIVASDNALNELANLVFALSFIGGLA
jgi:hypothetical protein